MSRRRFGQLQVFSFEIGKRDIAVDLLDEIVPICLVEAELSTKEVTHLLDILMRQKHLLDHHTIFLECTTSKPPPNSTMEMSSQLYLSMKVLFIAKLNKVKSCKSYNHALKEVKSLGVSVMH